MSLEKRLYDAIFAARCAAAKRSPPISTEELVLIVLKVLAEETA